MYKRQGVGITPIISMLEALAKKNASCGGDRNIWFIHGATNSKTHAFSNHVKNITSDWPSAQSHYAYSAPLATDIQGSDYDSQGRVSIDLLKSLLPINSYGHEHGNGWDCDFYFCGPPAFMESIYKGLKQINIQDDRIHYEFFGPGASLLKSQPGENKGLIGEPKNQTPVSVRFEKSGIEVDWEPSKGTLLDLAEKQGLTPPYSCRSGVCGTCATKIIEGDVAYVDPPLAETAAGQALICCAYPGKSAKQNNLLKLDL
ncbi:MAG: iron-sulfur cluster-binding domain-containing protein [Porticoccaceae bacterium]|nr:iron-sulfur cluster-binding domain-containing protein [Porticoccaceae bacterium]